MTRYLLFLSTFLFPQLLLAQGNVGVGTTPHAAAQLHVETGASSTKGLLVAGKHNLSSTVPDLPTGSYFFYYPGKAATRAGVTNGAQWSNSNVGHWSVAMGHETTASAGASTAFGSNTTASGGSSTALGYANTASGTYATAMGAVTKASGDASTATGLYTVAKGAASTVVGLYNDSLLSADEIVAPSPATPLFIVGNGNGFYDRSNALVVRKNGNVGVGTDASFAKLSLVHNSSLASPSLALYEREADYARLQFYNAGTNRYWHTAAYSDAANHTNSKYNIYYFNGSSGNDVFSISGNGNAVLSGSLTQLSDARTKRNITRISHALQRMLLLNGYHYHWQESTRDSALQSGVLAQEVQKVFPELVKENEKGLLSVNYTGLVPYLIEATKEQQKQLEEKQQQLNQQQQQIDDLKARLQSIEKLLLNKE